MKQSQTVRDKYIPQLQVIEKMINVRVMNNILNNNKNFKIYFIPSVYIHSK